MSVPQRADDLASGLLAEAVSRPAPTHELSAAARRAGEAIGATASHEPLTVVLRGQGYGAVRG